MRALVVGYGYMGQIRRRVIEESDDIELVGVCDQFIDPGEIGSACPHYIDVAEAIGASQPDIVFVCTPNRYSPDISVYAIERGCHVFCEKPPGRNLADIRKIIAAEQGRPELKVMFGFNHRHHPAILEAKSIVDAGRMGRVLWLRGLYGKSGGLGKEFESSWRNDPTVSGGGILLDQGIHMLDLFRFFCGDFPEVQGMLSTCYWDVGVEDNAFVLLRSDAGQTAQLHSSATLWNHTFNLDIGLEEGYLSARGLLSKTGSYGRETLVVGRKSKRGEAAAVGNPREEVVYFDQDLSWELQVDELVKCIREDLPVGDSSTTDALRVMEIIDAVYDQAGISETEAVAKAGGL
jgi:predicted dehydrogenase